MDEEGFRNKLVSTSDAKSLSKSGLKKQGSEEEDFILNVAPLNEVQEKEKQINLHS